jgi:hypothetical protein
MRELLRYQIPVEAGNDAIRTGKIAQVNEALMARVQPEPAYFFGDNGKRTGPETGARLLGRLVWEAHLGWSCWRREELKRDVIGIME